MGVLGKYKNGNYFVTLLDDGTKIRYNDSDSFNPDKPESMDLKITNKCNMGCNFCHEDSSPNGKHGDILNLPFIDTLLPYTEIAIGGGNPLTHPDLVPFLEKLKERKLIANITFNQYHFMDNIDFVQELVDKKLVYGIGVSMMYASDKFVECVSKFPNAVIHVINGIVSVDDLKMLADHNLKILILGYKEFRRGKQMYSRQSTVIDNTKSALYDTLPSIIDDGWFDVVSFDNLAIKQLEPKRLMSEEQWDQFYMGDDGSFTMYVDAVERKFAKSSTSVERYDLLDNIKPMFDKVRGM
jgi:hypothetical protein